MLKRAEMEGMVEMPLVQVMVGGGEKMKNTLSYLTLFAALSIPGMVYAKGDQWRDCCCSDYNLKGEHGEKEQRGIAGQCCPSPYQENDDLSSCKEACYDTQGHGRKIGR